MAMNQFADISKDLYTQIKVVENLVKGDLYKEARKLLSAAEATCNNLESLMEPDNRIQTNILNNRRREISWIQEAIQHNTAKAKVKPVRKPASKTK
ncbi:MAG: hypothetical protein ABSF74_02270 [Dehalococcoidia bacterium]|jgi:hypothetical protein